MSTAEAAYATHLYDWLSAQPELDEPCIHVEAHRRRKALPFDWRALGFGCVVDAS
jgi:hypothetical protein